MIIDDLGVKHTKVLDNNLKIISLVPSFTEFGRLRIRGPNRSKNKFLYLS